MSLDNNSIGFLSDYHGNMGNVDAFLGECQRRDVDHVILGGDTAPKKTGVVFSDGLGLSLYDTESVNIESLRSADQLWRDGISALDSEMSSADFFTLKIAIHRLLQMTAHSLQATGFNEEELRLLERHLTPKIHSFFSDPENLSHIERLCGHLDKPGVPKATPESLEQAYISYYRIQAVKSRFGEDEWQANCLKIFNKALPRGQYILRVLECMDLVRANTFAFQLIIRGKTPWESWKEESYEVNDRMERAQMRFIDELIARIDDFRSASNAEVAIILGNDDYPSLDTQLEKASKQGVLLNGTDKVVRFNNSLAVLGYSHIPPGDVSFDAWFSSEEVIAEDLARLHGNLEQGEKWIGSIHCPPDKSDLSREVYGGTGLRDFGSSSVRSFILKTQPSICLSGHVHNAWRSSGQISELIGNTRVFNPGASEYEARMLFTNVAGTKQELVTR